MANIVLRMNAFLNVEIGMKVYYDCPSMSGENWEADEFFQKYRGALGTIVGFSTEYVGPLDTKGRLPGTYYRPSNIDVQFDGEDEVHRDLNVMHFVLVSPTTTVDLNMRLTHQRAGDLPSPIQFYPGDVVYKTDDLLQAERIVERVNINAEGRPIYVLAETSDDRVAREKEDAERRKKARMFSLLMSSLPWNETCFGEQLKLVTAGNVHQLYIGKPSKMRFDSLEDEVRFWAHEGLSRTIYDRNGTYPRWKFSFEEARELLESGKGDLIIRSHQSKNMKTVGTPGNYQIHRLHDCFNNLRVRISALAHKLEVPPNEVERSLQDSLQGLVEKR